uniref:protein xylosyltransferase n=1 Tax=Strigamia maritima TaxID=126957 RepID=T1INJ3_STRMM
MHVLVHSFPFDVNFQLTQIGKNMKGSRCYQVCNDQYVAAVIGMRHNRKAGEYLGCFRDQQNARLLTGHMSKLASNTPTRCLDLCLQSGFQLAGVQYSHECFCGDDVPTNKAKVGETLCDLKCPEDENLICGGFYYMNVYYTGLQKAHRTEIHLKPDPDVIPVRILYVLTLNGRAVRQVRRLLKNLYHTRNYYYIHVDVRQDYLYRQLLVLEEQFANIRLSRRRMSTIWGGASLLQMLLQCMEDTLKMTHWKWDFFINLSESDFPIKVSEDLVNFLTANREKNFVKSHGKDTQRFIGKQGLDKTFYECDTHMWRVGDRKLPWGVRIDGGSDWVALSRGFCGYLVTSKDDLVVGLKTVYAHTLLPAESFFHTVLRNSEFCNTYVNNNLRLTNWKRKIGCRCQYEHIVDWCGCSPNDFKPDDWTKIQSTKEHLYFFARKFEPVINQKIIDQVETWLYGSQEHGLNKHWQNEYHHLDVSPKPNDAFLTAYHSITRLSVRLFKSKHEKCKISPAKVLEATTYNDNDSYKGTLILFEATIGRQKTMVRFETLASPLRHYAMFKPVGPTSRLKDLQVGTDYDQKEQLFRNFARILGPLSELYVMHKWGPGNAFYATFAWVDPTNTVVTTYEAKILAGVQVDFHKPPLQRPLRPGVWTVKLLYTWQVVAETKFLVTPTSFMNGLEIGHEHVRKKRFVHSGPIETQKNENFTGVERLLGLSKTKASLLRQANSNAQRYAKDLLDWIDNLTSQFYVVQETCHVGDEFIDGYSGCANVKIEACHSSRWSSRSPDPKTEIGGIDEKTGRLMRVY